jgi:DNA-binding transcriptional regulator YhcF (GntR family)
MTQDELADATALTPVHVNRTLQRLRNEGLISFQRGRLTIVDMGGLQRAAGFDPSYLHIKRRVAVSA